MPFACFLRRTSVKDDHFLVTALITPISRKLASESEKENTNKFEICTQIKLSAQ